MWGHLKRIVKSDGAICLFGSEPFSSSLRISNIEMFRYDWIYEKVSAKGHLNARKRPLSAHETVSVFYRQPPKYYPIKTQGHTRKVANKVNRGKKQTEVYRQQKGSTDYDSTERYPRSVIKFSNGARKELYHPTQKPVALLEYLIKTYTLEGETVLDFTMGGGATGIACINLNRSFIGIEKEETYFKIAEKRIDELNLDQEDSSELL